MHFKIALGRKYCCGRQEIVWRTADIATMAAGIQIAAFIAKTMQFIKTNRFRLVLLSLSFLSAVVFVACNNASNTADGKAVAEKDSLVHPAVSNDSTEREGELNFLD